MQAFAGVAFILLVASALFVGVRLLVLSRQTGGTPEKILGAMLISLMGVGYPLAVVTQAEPVIGVVAARIFQNLSNFFIDFGFAMTFLFTWQVFRPSSAWARAFTILGCSLLTLHFGAVAWMISGLDSMAQAMDVTRRVALVSLACGGVGYGWSSLEAFHYRGMLQRRMALGMAEPLVSNRFFLWGWMGAITAAGAVLNAWFLVTYVDVVRDPMAQGIVASIGILQAALLHLTFHPPAAYRRRLERGR